MWKNNNTSIRAKRLIDALLYDLFAICSDSKKSDAQKLVDIRTVLKKAVRLRRYLDCDDGMVIQTIFALIKYAKYAWDIYFLITNCHNKYAYHNQRIVFAAN